MQIKSKFIAPDAVDGSKIKLKKDEALRGTKQDGSSVDLVKLDGEDKVLLKGSEAAFKSDVSAEQSRAQGVENSLQAEIDAEELARAAGDTATLSSAQSYTDQKITDLVGAAPAALNTLKEIADAINNDASIAATLTSSIASTQAEVDALEGVVAGINIGTAQARFVDKTGVDATADGSRRKPFGSITAALASITDASATKRYVIKVGPGAYSEAGIALKANVFVIGDMQDAVRITAPVTMASDFSGSADNRSGFSNVTLLSAVNFDWSTVTSAAGKLYLNEVVFGSTLRLYGHNNAIAQAQIQSCEIFGTMTVSGINIGIYSNNVNFGEIKLDQHPNGGMATILAASGGRAGKITLTTTVNDFNRRCSLFAYAGFFIDELIVNGASSYADLSESSVPRDPAKLVSSNGGNVVYLTSTVPHKTNERSVGQPGKQYLYNFAYVHGSTESDLYVISMGNSYSADSAGRSINVEADSYGLNSNVNGGDINLVTASVSGTGVRGKIKLSARQIDADSAKIVNVADATASNDAVNKSQLDAEATARASADDALDVRLDALEAAIGALSSKQEKFTITSQVLAAGSVTLAHKTLLPGSVGAYLGRLGLFAGEDFTLSTNAEGYAVLTFAGDLAPGGVLALEENDVIRVQYLVK
jgi:hypothetical protein